MRKAGNGKYKIMLRFVGRILCPYSSDWLTFVMSHFPLLASLFSDEQEVWGMKSNICKQLKGLKILWFVSLGALLKFSTLSKIMMISLLRIAPALSSPKFAQFLRCTVVSPSGAHRSSVVGVSNHCVLQLGGWTYSNITFVCWTAGFNQQNTLTYHYQRSTVGKMIPQCALQIRKEQYTTDGYTAEKSVLNLGL